MSRKNYGSDEAYEKGKKKEQARYYDDGGRKSKQYRKRWTKDEIEYILDKTGVLTDKEIAQRLKRSTKSIQHMRRRVKTGEKDLLHMKI